VYYQPVASIVVVYYPLLPYNHRAVLFSGATDVGLSVVGLSVDPWFRAEIVFRR